MTVSRPTHAERPVLPISVRIAQPSDTRAVLDFTRATWDGWDYLPLVWRDWLEASDGVLLVAVAQEPAPGIPPELDLFGRPFGPDRPIGVARVAMLSPAEAWLEGLRVDPGVRNRGVARLLHAASLAWAKAQGAAVVRYATGEENEASHRVGGRSGFRLLHPWRAFQQPSDPVPDADDAGAAAADADQPWDLGDDADQVPVDVSSRAVAEAAVGDGLAEAPDGVESAAPAWLAADVHAPETVRRLRGASLALDPDASGELVSRWWQRVEHDETFQLGERLHEARSWAFVELTEPLLAAHVAAGEVLVRESRAGWALAIVPTADLRFEGDRPWTALLAGHWRAALDLAVEAQRALRRPLRIRVPDEAPVVRGHENAFGEAGFHRGHETLHLLARALRPDEPIDMGPPGALVLADTLRRLTRPPAPPRPPSTGPAGSIG